MADLETLLPGFKKVWPEIKALCGTSQRHPKLVCFTDKPEQVYPNDYDQARRISLNLETMQVEGTVHISAGEWACHGGSNNDREVTAIPTTHALLTCTYSDYHRTFTMVVQVAKLPEALSPPAQQQG
jgi:hypothetical protein